MAEIFNLDPTDGNNTGRWPDGMVGGQINDAGREMEGYLARWYQDLIGITATGSSNAFTVNPSRTISALTTGLRQSFIANHSITGASTLDILDGSGAKPLKRWNGSATATGDIVAGQIVDVAFRTDSDAWFMMSVPAALTGNMFADFDENAAPGDPAADDARLYAFDDGGVTVLGWRDSAGVVSPLRVATQAEMETPDDNRIVRADRQHFHPGHSKAGGNLNGSGTPAFRSGDYGMGAVTDNGVGDYTVAFDTSFNNTNYWCAGFGRSTSDDTIHMGALSALASGSKLAGSIRLKGFDVGGGSAGADNDLTEMGMSFWGDYA